MLPGVHGTSLLPLVRLLRPREWIKNGFVLAPAIFSGRILNPDSAIGAVTAALLFSVAASAAYIVNDIQDVERDRVHPRKRVTRPIASGEVTIPTALTVLGGLYALLGAGIFFLLPATAAPLLAYVALNLAYSWWLKDAPIIDLFVVASGFMLRLYVGARAIDVPLSSWMMITTLALALYLASTKRLQELKAGGPHARPVLAFYSVTLLERYAEASASSAIAFYGLFVITVRPELALTIPFVLFGLFRYWYIVDVTGAGESPTEAMWTDWQLIATVVLWIGFSVAALSIGPSP
ncbi:MAG TPA: decaprenyl-phosphate phosphoribosyltransferase [Gemmatimonadaceae bacterium]|nr:decaprenyl-phosphate phosphoribosyltransferase [Gemmatimonadaceae bacterium]